MATYGPVQLPAFLGDDATFRTWAQGVHAALASFADLTQTADTGQIDLATATRPAAANTAAGYEMWRFNDALQATVPVFLKIEYGVAASVDKPCIWLTVGGATNGAGTLTAPVTSRYQVPSNQSKAAGNLLPLLASAEPGRLDLALNVDVGGTSAGMFMHVERTRDATGAATAAGWWMTGLTSGGLGGSASYSATANTLFSSGTTAPWLPPAGTAAFRSPIGGESAIGTVVFFMGKPAYALGVVSYTPAELTTLTTFSASVLGAVRTFVALGTSPGYITGSSAGITGIAMKWD